MQLTPLIAIHMAAAIAAVVTGPVALWPAAAAATGRTCTALSATRG